MVSAYPRSVILRTAGAVVSIAVWLGLIVFALDNLDTGLPDSEGLAGGWPFWLAAVAISALVLVYLMRSPGSPGWGHFLIGLLIPEVAFFVNRLATTEVGVVFWVAVAVLILIPIPSRQKAGAAPLA